MSKYEPLATHLSASGHAAVPMSFSEIERIIGAELPASAFRHRAWWSNNPSNSVITYAWLKAGYKSADVDMPGRRLVFRKAARNGDLSPSGGEPPVPESSEANGAPASTDAAGQGLFSRIYGALKGTVTVKPGTDLTAPDGTDWYGKR